MLELSESIKQHGVIQPITLRKVADHKYQIIAGERRYRASTMAGKDSIPAYVIDASDELVMEMALIENIQREDLNSIEVALSYQNLMDVCNYTQEQLAERVGKKRATVSNYLRLLRLPGNIQVGIKDKKIDMGHARALLSVEDPVKQLEIYDAIQRDGLSVRKVEELVRGLNEENEEDGSTTGGGGGKTGGGASLPDEYVLLKDVLTDMFGQKVDLVRNAKGKGKITIPFSNDEQFEKIMEIFDSVQKR
jgi:ParB family chromosome partitioning protein